MEKDFFLVVKSNNAKFRLERDQNRFLSYAEYLLRIDHLLHNYHSFDLT